MAEIVNEHVKPGEQRQISFWKEPQKKHHTPNTIKSQQVNGRVMIVCSQIAAETEATVACRRHDRDVGRGNGRWHNCIRKIAIKVEQWTQP